MDRAKRNQLVARLVDEPEPRLVPIAEYFDGNDDPASIGCNLAEHPGVEAFRSMFAELAKRPDVAAIYAQIAELEPGEEHWPFTDTIFVVGTIKLTELAKLLKPLAPDEVGLSEGFSLPSVLTRRHTEPVMLAWWD